MAVGSDESRQTLAPGRVELGHDVIEEHQRRRGADRERVALREQQREQGDPLLSLRSEGAERSVRVQEHQVVAVRSVRGEAALEVAPSSLAQLGSQAIRVIRAAAWCVAELGRLGQPELGGALGEGRAHQFRGRHPV